MVHLEKFFKNKTGKYLLSVILGLGIASLFRKVCKEKNCVVFKAPPLEDIKDKVYKYEDKCYKYELVSAHCDKTKKILPL